MTGLALLCLITLNACERTVTTVQEVQAPSNCFGCHSDQDTRLVAAEEQYARSQHASGENIDRNYSTCVNCHVSEGFVARVTGVELPVSNPTAIHCFTCHAPHTNSDLSLRITEPQPLQDGTEFDLGSANICVACHQSRRNVNTYVVAPVELEERWGPHHSVQGDMLIGSNGYEYDFYQYERTNHRGATSNGCLDCHFAATSNYRLGGHSFNMTWEDQEHTAGCLPCHEIDAFDDVVRVQTVTDSLVVELRSLLFNANLIDDEDLPLEVTVADADSAGAVWNFLMAHDDRSEGVHNRKYIQGLLESSIQFMQGVPLHRTAAHKEDGFPGTQ